MDPIARRAWYAVSGTDLVYHPMPCPRITLPAVLKSYPDLFTEVLLPPISSYACPTTASRILLLVPYYCFPYPPTRCPLLTEAMHLPGPAHPEQVGLGFK
eukprot:2712046-Rhodomonas_salina.1